MGKLKDMIPKADDVMNNKDGWLTAPLLDPIAPGAGFQRTVTKYGQGQRKEDSMRKTIKAEYDQTHPGVILPTRSDTKITGARAAANRRRSGRISTVLSDQETLG